MSKEYLNPSNLPDWGQAFTQIVIIQGPAKTVYISGQVSVDKDKYVIGGNDLGKQAMQAFHNLETAIKAVGAHTTDVVKLTIYIKNYQPTDAPLINLALRKVFTGKNLPASTWLGVQALAQEEFLIEVDAILMKE